MATYNRITLVGYLTKDPQLHNQQQSDKQVAKARIAVSQRHTDKRGELVERPMFIDLAFFGRNAEVASRYLKTGSQVLVEGRIDMYEWEDGSTRRQKHSVTVSKLVMLGKPKNATEGAEAVVTDANGASSEQAGEIDVSI